MQVPFFQSDGLSITAVEPWFKVKVQLIERYVQSFIANAAGRVDDIVLVDLCSGSGLFSFGHQKEIFASPCLSLLSANLPISRWIFCERDHDQVYALQSRVAHYFRNKNVTILDEPVDDLAGKLQSLIPQTRGNKTAVLCIVDPFSFEIPYTTIDKLASIGFSFLMPFTWMMNQRMSHAYYLEEHREKIKQYLGIADLQRLAAVQSNQQFYKHIVRIYQNNMLVLGLNTALSVHKVESRLMELPAYYIGFFSKKFSTKAVLNAVNESEHVQFELW
ncbi:three-Cys-motif partner protein TcmP [Ohtaekwangia koreensis]|uniref:Three-Cys-motif partner protein n=1 Tax=Ohtaekwangia koreensis TaxID=688867 RepID=A0A1T5JLH0_9BACT|nr:three-Cys-motif partner protein TcmP [Ohtaekwangia koreensis]SKC52265.1 three-Cys-motif partner protein [Ohtaekwangia koreensis]